MEKLIRDSIPEIAKAKGQPISYRVAGPDEYPLRLVEKVWEELGEFLKDENPEEMGDLLDVLEAIADDKEWNFQDILKQGVVTVQFPQRDQTWQGILTEAISVFMKDPSPASVSSVVGVLQAVADGKGWPWISIEQGRAAKSALKGKFHARIIATF